MVLHICYRTVLRKKHCMIPAKPLNLESGVLTHFYFARSPGSSRFGDSQSPSRPSFAYANKFWNSFSISIQCPFSTWSSLTSMLKSMALLIQIGTFQWCSKNRFVRLAYARSWFQTVPFCTPGFVPVCNSRAQRFASLAFARLRFQSSELKSEWRKSLLMRLSSILHNTTPLQPLLWLRRFR